MPAQDCLLDLGPDKICGQAILEVRQVKIPAPSEVCFRPREATKRTYRVAAVAGFIEPTTIRTAVRAIAVESSTNPMRTIETMRVLL